MRCSLIIVGDEILAGHVADANAPWLLERIAGSGHEVRRVVVIADDPEQIAAEVREGLAARSGMVVVCGGLGPTHDDRTMEGVARALGRPLTTCEPLAEMIEGVIAAAARSGFSGASFGEDGFRKMALAPEGAELLRCSIGVVPAVVVELPSCAVVVLPGPPRELRAVFAEAVEPRYLAGTGRTPHRAEITHPFPEATLAALLTGLQERFPGVAIGSYPRAGDALIRITGAERDVAAIAAEVQAYIAAVSATDEGARLIAFMAERRARRSGVESG